MGGKGGGGSTNSTVTQNTTTLPPYAEPYWKDIMQRGAAASAEPYKPYGGSRIAEFSPYEQEGMARMAEFGMTGDNQNLTDSSGFSKQAGNMQLGPVDTNIQSQYQAGDIGGEGAYNPTSRESGYTAGRLGKEGYYTGNQRQMGFEAGSLNDADMMQSYMNPYTQNVVDIQKREAMRDADMRHQATGLDAAGAGALGGYREGIMRSETERNLGQQLGDIQATGQQAAFANAQQAYEQDRAARAQQEQFGQSQFGMNEQIKQRMAELRQSGFSADEAAKQAQEQFAQGQFGMNSANSQFGANLGLQRYQAQEQAKQAAQGFGLQAAGMNQAGQLGMNQNMLGLGQNMLGASGQLGNNANQQQQMLMERLGLLTGVGGQQRQQMQQGLDMGYQDWMRQQAYPKEQVSWLMNLMQGNAMQPGSTQTTYGQTPSSLQQMMGAGIAGMGMYNSYNNMGRGG